MGLGNLGCGGCSRVGYGITCCQEKKDGSCGGLGRGAAMVFLAN